MPWPAHCFINSVSSLPSKFLPADIINKSFPSANDKVSLTALSIFLNKALFIVSYAYLPKYLCLLSNSKCDSILNPKLLASIIPLKVAVNPTPSLPLMNKSLNTAPNVACCDSGLRLTFLKLTFLPFTKYSNAERIYGSEKCIDLFTPIPAVQG